MARIPPIHVTSKDGAPVVIRCTELDDALEVIALDKHVVETSPFNVRSPEERDWDETKQREWIRERLDDPGGLAIIAVAPTPGGDSRAPIIGGLGFKCSKPLRMRHHGYFGIGLHADWRGRGIGTHLVQTLIDWARTHEFLERIDLGVFAANTPARALYSKLGFVEVCVREREFRYGPDHYEDDVQMSLRVK